MKKGEKKKQQKALARRKERQAANKGARPNPPSPAQTTAIRAARSYPLLGCWAQRGWQDAGIAAVIVARRQPDGLITFGSYVVDYYCLGVKNAMVHTNVSDGRFMNEILPQLTQGAPVKIEAAVAHELIYGSVEYAARWGFRPHSDFKLAQLVLDPADQYPPTGKVAFGKDGKPFYVSGPYDQPEAVVRQLARTAGEGNFDYLVFAGPPDSFDDDEAEFEVLPLDEG
jgi:hypothetical protein